MTSSNKSRIAFVSLGCPKNQIDTEIMLSELAAAGYEIVEEDINADVIIINTCGFIQSAKQEGIDNILDAAWLKTNRSLRGIVVTGCMAERYREQIFEQLPEVDAMLGTGSIHHICEAVRSVLEKKPDEAKYSSFDDKETMPLGGDRVVTTPEYSVYLKLAEGCSNCCAYCAIPQIRGRFRSRTPEAILAEARTLIELGAKEITLVAQDITRWGEDLYGAPSLPKLLRELCKLDVKWLRLLYTYPELIDDELVEVIKTEPKIIKYIDMPIQHINADILRAMGRRGGPEAIQSALARLRAVEGMVIRSTVIVGFPGETDEQFGELLKFIKAAQFERLGAFEYSAEEGTPAAAMPEQIKPAVKKRRYARIMEAQNIITNRFNDSRIGKVVEVLAEEWDGASGAWFTRSYADAPEIDGKIYIRGGRRLLKVGEFADVRLTETLDYDMIGERV